MTVFAVVYSNYDPSEVHSLWKAREKAELKRDELNRRPGSAKMWEVEEMDVQE